MELRRDREAPCISEAEEAKRSHTLQAGAIFRGRTPACCRLTTIAMATFGAHSSNPTGVWSHVA